MRWIPVVLILLTLTCVSHSPGQTKKILKLEDFVGTWKVDMEKTYSKSERKKVANYSVKISLNVRTLTVYWDYTMVDRGKDQRSYFHDTFVLDGKEKAIRRGDTGGALAQTAKFDGRKIKCSYGYGINNEALVILDYRTFAFSSDNKYLVIESLFRSTGKFTQNQTESKTLYLTKEY